MREVFDLVQSVADARSTVLITGTSGNRQRTDRAGAALYIQPHPSGPFIKLNCAALPENLVEAELFGYEKGAFTDAKKTNRGGSSWPTAARLLLDEISEMPLNLQSKLLRVIQEREFERMGSSQTIAGRCPPDRDLQPQPERVHLGRAGSARICTTVST